MQLTSAARPPPSPPARFHEFIADFYRFDRGLPARILERFGQRVRRQDDRAGPHCTGPYGAGYRHSSAGTTARMGRSPLYNCLNSDPLGILLFLKSRLSNGRSEPCLSHHPGFGPSLGGVRGATVDR